MADNNQDLEHQIGFPPNGGRSSEELFITNSPMAHALVRSWLQRQGIPYKAAKSALPKSLASAYVNQRYLNSWRTRINPQWELLGTTSDDWSERQDVEATTNATTNAATPPPPASTQSSPQSEAWLKDLLGQINKTVNTLVEERLAKATLKIDESAKEAIRTLAKDTAQAAIEELAKPRTIEIHSVETGEFRSLGLQHERFPLLLRATQARDHRGYRLNIWLTGPTGSGKTSAAEACAKALALTFGSDGSLDADYKVLGFRDANGNIISTQFLDIYENGGIYVADEIDNWMPSALLSLNAALANGWCSSPRGLIQRHKDACVIACANTWGLGATGDYVGRTRLDAASLDRFQPKIDWPVDERLERAIAEQQGGDEGIGWHNTVLDARRKAAAQGLKIIISPRATFSGIALLKAGFDIDETVQMTFASGLSAEQKKAIGASYTAKRSQERLVPEIYNLLRHGDRIGAIKLYCELNACDLITARDAIDAVEKERAA